ncbi:MAG TPA: DUF4407 domain-containing protein [Pseudonocardiaceae bacterium]|jgi:hypothetical protein|nr:DUF4407 domain-containing protein [Pseudonocardiaceae bacterium]
MTIRMGLARLAGARTNLLRKSPGDLNKQSAMGGVLLTTAGVATISAFFAVRTALDAPWLVSVLVGLAWGVVILNLDRMLIISMSGLRTVRLKLIAAIPRLLLALVIGSVISTPLVLRIFQHEINAQLTVLQAQGVQQSEDALNNAYVRIGQLTKQQTQLQGTIDGETTSSVSSDPDVEAATKAYQDANSTYQQLNQSVQCELDGTCGTGHAGDGQSYQSKKAAADSALQVSDEDKTQLDQVTAAATKRLQDGAAQAVAQARQQLPSVQRELAQATSSRDSLEQQSFQEQKQNNGLLARMEALEQITGQSSTAWWTHMMLFLLFVCIELLPVVTKVLTSFGPPSLYEWLADREDEDAAEIEDIRAKVERDIVDRTARARLAIAQQQLDDQIEAGKIAAKVVADEQSKITLKAIAVWAELAQLRATEELDRWYQDNVGGSAPRQQTVSNSTPLHFAPVAGPTAGAPTGAAHSVPQHNGWHGRPLNGSTP